MAEVFYYSNHKIELSDIKLCADEIGLIADIYNQAGELVVYVEETVDGGKEWLCTLSEPNGVFEGLPNEFIQNSNETSIYLLEFSYSKVEKVCKLLQQIMIKYSGWLVDDYTPNFHKSTKGKSFIYHVKNIHLFGS